MKKQHFYRLSAILLFLCIFLGISFLHHMVLTPKTDTETDTAYFYLYFSQSFPIQGSAMIAHQNAQVRILHIVRNVFAFEIVIPPKP